jgi:hypothetical protein
MNNGDVSKLVRDFEAGARQGNGDFSLVYADLLEMKHSGASKDQLNRELYQVNCALVQDGAIPVSTAGGLPQFILIDADSHGHIITANPATQQMEARDLNLNVLGTVTPTYGDPYRQGYPQYQYDGQGPQYYPQNGNQGYNGQPQYYSQNDNLGYNSQNDNQANQGYNSPQNNPQYGDQGYYPPQNNQQNDNYQYDGSGSCPQDQPSSGQAPHHENWSGRDFFIQAEGSARY